MQITTTAVKVGFNQRSRNACEVPPPSGPLLGLVGKTLEDRLLSTRVPVSVRGRGERGKRGVGGAGELTDRDRRSADEEEGGFKPYAGGGGQRLQTPVEVVYCCVGLASCKDSLNGLKAPGNKGSTHKGQDPFTSTIVNGYLTSLVGVYGQGCVAKMPIRQHAKEAWKQGLCLLAPSLDLQPMRSPALHLHCHCSAMSLPHRPNLGHIAVSPVYIPLTVPTGSPT
jgi:hypothetical protein